MLNTRMEGADLRRVRMEAAVLRGARMEGAFLIGARMERADLGWVTMEGADLRRAQMEAADLSWTRVDGANLIGARMDGATDLMAVNTFGAAAQGVDWSKVNWTADQIKSMFGDASVTLPEGISRPAHWPDWELPSRTENDFHTQWQKWLSNPDAYEPPENPETP